MISQLTIDLPVRVAQRLAALAAEQKKSVEAIALESLTVSLEKSPIHPRGNAARSSNQIGFYQN